MTKIYAPNREYNGITAGVQFKNGVGDTDDSAALGYLGRAGYGIGEYKAPPTEAPVVDARDAAGPIPLGTRLRDAAVDPRATDFLPPINAGLADPHGPDVVAPQLHADQTGPIRPGEVFVDDAARQSDEESALDKAVLVDQQPATIASEIGRDGDASDITDAEATDGLPAKSATKAAWVDYAVSQGAAREEAEDMTKAALAQRFAEGA